MQGGLRAQRPNRFELTGIKQLEPDEEEAEAGRTRPTRRRLGHGRVLVVQLKT